MGNTGKRRFWLLCGLNMLLLTLAAARLAWVGIPRGAGLRIRGARDLTYCVGQTPAYFRGVRVCGGQDTGLTLKVDSTRVDLTAPGVYPLVYTARDAEGNVTSLEVSVTVLASPEKRA